MSEPPSEELPSDVRALEREALQHSDSEEHHARLLRAFCSNGLYRHRRRIEHILDFISRFPHSITAKTPFVHVDPVDALQDFNAIEALWARLRSEDSSEPELAIGHAALVANHDRSRAAEILRGAIASLPENAALWTELGRVAPEPSEQLDAFQRARALGSTQPNLLVWLGRAAVDAGRSDAVYGIGCELLARADQTRATVSFPIPWQDTGRDAWRRLRTALEHSPDRQRLITAGGRFANDTHWAHTFLGLVAAERGQLQQAREHLLSSSRIWGEPRLSSYGPSCFLARKLCEAGMWTDVEAYLVACKDFWANEVLEEWLEDVRNQRLPDFDEP